MHSWFWSLGFLADTHLFRKAKGRLQILHIISPHSASVQLRLARHWVSSFVKVGHKPEQKIRNNDSIYFSVCDANQIVKQIFSYSKSM